MLGFTQNQINPLTGALKNIQGNEVLLGELGTTESSYREVKMRLKQFYLEVLINVWQGDIFFFPFLF